MRGDPEQQNKLGNHRKIGHHENSHIFRKLIPVSFRAALVKLRQ